MGPSKFNLRDLFGILIKISKKKRGEGGIDWLLKFKVMGNEK